MSRLDCLRPCLMDDRDALLARLARSWSLFHRGCACIQRKVCTAMRTNILMVMSQPEPISMPSGDMYTRDWQLGTIECALKRTYKAYAEGPLRGSTASMSGTMRSATLLSPPRDMSATIEDKEAPGWETKLIPNHPIERQCWLEIKDAIWEDLRGWTVKRHLIKGF